MRTADRHLIVTHPPDLAGVRVTHASSPAVGVIHLVTEAGDALLSSRVRSAWMDPRAVEPYRDLLAEIRRGPSVRP